VDFGPEHFAQHPDRQVGRWYGRSAAPENAVCA
jgi:hypothetical protein